MLHYLNPLMREFIARQEMVFIDFFHSTVGLHVNGKAQVLDNQDLLLRPDLPPAIIEAMQTKAGRGSEQWILVEVAEAYIHCSKHVPLLQKLSKDIHWGTDDEHDKGGDAFKAKACPRPWDKDSTTQG